LPPGTTPAAGSIHRSRSSGGGLRRRPAVEAGGHGHDDGEQAQAPQGAGQGVAGDRPAHDDPDADVEFGLQRILDGIELMVDRAARAR
jgi:hypothetical protein